jgi:hypothetical protein
MPALVLPTVTPAEDCSACPSPHRPDPESERQLASLGRELDGVMVDAAQDLGLTVDVSARLTPGPLSERALFEKAATSWVFSPRISPVGQKILLRIIAVAPGTRVILTRSEEIKPDELEVRTVLMLKDLVDVAARPGSRMSEEESATEPEVATRARSRGTAVLALNAAILGGFIGYSLQRASGSTDARLTYPLTALGAGLGVGAAMIVADEWDVGTGDAWYLAAGTWWPLIGGVLLADASGGAQNRRFLYGTGAAVGGIALATTALTFGGMGEGGALATHSGGAYGTMLGGIAELIARGSTSTTPSAGMGIGAIAGVVSAGLFATVSPGQAPSRILLIDLAAGLGGLTGAALGSPLVFGEDVGKTRNRLWLSSIALGTFVGAGVGIVMTHSRPNAPQARLPVLPVAGVIDTVSNPDGSLLPVHGVGARGFF